LPAVAALGIGAVLLVAFQFVGLAAVPLNLTVLIACAALTFVPVIVTTFARGPDVTDRPVM
jgi:hypothetical protein